MRIDGVSSSGAGMPAVGLYVGTEIAIEEVLRPEAGQRRGEFECDVFSFGTALGTPKFERIDSDVLWRNLPAEIGDRGIDGIEYRSQAETISELIGMLTSGLAMKQMKTYCGAS